MRPESPWWNFLAYYWVILIILIILSHFNYYLRKLWLRRICLQCRRPGFHPCIRKIPWKREGQPTPVSLPGESHEERSLEDHSPWGHKESNTTGWLTHTQGNCKMHPFFFFFGCTMWNFSSTTCDQVQVPTLGAWSLNHWITSEVP